jgi:F-type H+-transporting ATPase subunit b
MIALRTLIAAGGLIDVTALLAQGAIFLVLLGLLYKFFWKKVAAHLDERQASIRQTYDKIEADKAEVERLTRQYAEKLAGIEREAHAKLQEAVKEGQALRARTIADAQAEASAALEKARREIAIEKEKAVEELRAEVIRLTLAAAERVIGQTMTPELHGKLVDQALSDLDKTERGA